MKVKKVFFRQITSGKLKGFADIIFSVDETDEACLTIKGFKLFQGQDGEFVSFPSEKYEKDGETKYSDRIFIDKETKAGNLLINEITTKVIAQSKNNTQSKTMNNKNSKAKTEDDLLW